MTDEVSTEVVTEVTTEVYLERRKKWTDALRSGDYEQTHEVLNQNGKMCCLGVACDLYMKEHGGEWTPSISLPGAYTFADQATVAPKMVMEWLGLKSHNGVYHDMRCLAEDNDMGKTFDQIADIIDSNPKGLFTYA